MFCNIAASAIDYFANVHSPEHFRDDLNFNSGGRRMTLGMVVSMVLWILLVLFAGKWLWNNVLCQVCTVFKPMPSVFYVLGLVILTDILFPRL